jgi:hypothetical protein
VLTTIRGVHRGQAEITKRVGAHLVEDITNNFHLSGDGSAVDREQFQQVYGRLARAGYELEPEEEAWRRFERARGSYAGRLEVLAAYWATPATLWDGPKKFGVSSAHAQPTGAPARPPEVAARRSPAAEDALGQAASARVPE